VNVRQKRGLREELIIVTAVRNATTGGWLVRREEVSFRGKEQKKDLGWN